MSALTLPASGASRTLELPVPRLPNDLSFSELAATDDDDNDAQAYPDLGGVAFHPRGTRRRT